MNLEFLDFYFPFAGVTASILLLIFAGLFTGVLTGLYGLGGGFAVIPIMTVLGIPFDMAAATSANQMIASSIAALIINKNNKSLDMKLGTVFICIGVLGSISGYFLLKYINGFYYSDVILNVAFLALLISVTLSAIYQVGMSKLNGANEVSHTGALHNLPFKMSFDAFPKKVSIIPIILASFIAGHLVIILGIGGGIIIVPIFIYFYNAKKGHLSSAMQMQIVVTSIAATFLHSVLLHNIDIFLSFWLIIGGVVGSSIGVLLNKRMSQEQYKLSLMIILIIISAVMLHKSFSAPSDHIIIEWRNV